MRVGESVQMRRQQDRQKQKDNSQCVAELRHTTFRLQRELVLLLPLLLLLLLLLVVAAAAAAGPASSLILRMVT